MPDPASLRDMDKAAARIADAIVRREPVAIFGDYDVDGACSSALMARFLGASRDAARIYIPDRIFEGYGPNAARDRDAGQGRREADRHRRLRHDELRDRWRVPRGSAPTSSSSITIRRTSGCRTCSRRQSEPAGRRVGARASVRGGRRRSWCSSRVSANCAGAAAMQTASREPDLLGDARSRGAGDGGRRGAAARGSTAPMSRKGLAGDASRARTSGLRALFDAAGLNQAPTPYHLGFILGPRINAGGRIGDAALGARLLSTDDETEAARIAVLLDKLNKERKAIETQMLEEAMAEADRQARRRRPICRSSSSGRRRGTRASSVSSRAAWSSGSGGRAASSRGRSRQDRERSGTGSLRSIAGVDIGGGGARGGGGGTAASRAAVTRWRPA